MVFWEFLKIGIEHIWTGYDHLLFLFGLIIAKGTKWDYLKIITAFTLGHSVTLALASMNVVTLSPDIIEPLIALSIVYVTIENFFVKSLKKRWILTFAFGLIHGFGFAGILSGMSVGNAVVPLLSFNLGVEVGQIAVLLLVLPIIFMIQKSNMNYKAVNYTVSSVIGLLGAFWFFERIL